MTIAIVAFFGLFSLVGGIIGFFKAKSLASLIAGTISGLVLLASAYGISQGYQFATILSLVVAVLLGGRFLGTWIKKRKVMPDLLMVILSVITIISVAFSIFK